MGQGLKWTDHEKCKLRQLIEEGVTDDNTLSEEFPFRPLAGVRKMVWQLKQEDEQSAMDLLIAAEARNRVKKSLSGDLPHKLALMTGLKRSHLPIKQREHIANMVMGVEAWLQELPEVQIRHNDETKEAAVLMISDLHSGKKHYDDQGNTTYDKDTLARRLSELKSKVIHLIKRNLRPEKIDEFWILLIGDIVDGSGIYPNQELNQDLHAVQPQVSLAAAGIWDIVRTVRRELGYPVRIRGVRGNHGAQGKYAPAANNFDFMVYQALKMLAHYEDPEGVEVIYSTTTEYLNFEIKGHRGHIRHMAPTQTETAAARAKFGGWRETHKWDFMCYGHKHHPGNGTYMGFDTLMNGSFVGDDDLSERMAVGSRASQTLFGVDTEIGISFRYNMYLNEVGKGHEVDELIERYPALD